VKRRTALVSQHDVRVEETDFVAQTFGASGPFARAFAGYRQRDGQVELSQAISDVLRDGKILLGEAGTGVGKSFAALVPAIEHVRAGRGKVIVVTANIALQEQYVRKDLPTLQQMLGIPFTFALAKGFSNYLCNEKIDAADTDRMMGKRLPMFQEQTLLDKVLDWQTTTGDLSDFEVELPGSIKKLVTVPSEDCLGKKCNHFLDGCYPRKARRDFGAADIIVTNYHMYFLDLEMKMRGAHGVLPEHSAVIFDEAHAMAEIARTYLGLRVTKGGVKSATEELDAKGRRAEKLQLPAEIDPELKAQVLDAANDFFGELLDLRNSRRYKSRINKPSMIGGELLEKLLRNTADTYTRAAAAPSTETEAREWLRGRASLCNRYAALIEGARAFKDNEQIFYIEDENGHAALIREPLTPAKILKEHLWETDNLPRTKVLMSATLSTSSKLSPFGFIADQLGIETYDDCIADSPFDFTKCTFIVPRGLPEPRDEEFAEAVGETLVKTVDMARGRTLGLFTSYRVLDVAHRRLVAAGFPYKVMRQKDAPRTELIRRFKEDPDSILLGTDSFWTGVDVPGESLLAVLIDKIPFDHFEDPVLDAIKARDEAWFKTYYMPKAVITFKQGFGRLVRALDDRGAVVCCDKRITSKPYGRAFKDARPKGTAFSEKLSDVATACWPTPRVA
jgi:ATP-dependent DNA helicase DinG